MEEATDKIGQLTLNAEQSATAEEVAAFAEMTVAEADIDPEFDPLIHEYGSSEEKAAFAELQKLGADQATFQRCKPFWQLACLRARKYRLDRTLKLIDNYMNWRDTYHVETKTVANDPEFDACMHDGVVAAEGNMDRKGRYVVAVRIRRASPKERFTIEDKLRSTHAVLEQLLIKHPIVQARGVVMIVDFSDIDKGKHGGGDRNFTKQLFDSLNNNLPLRILGQYLVSPPWFIRWFLPIAKLFMKKKLQERTQLFSHGYSQLERCIANDQLAEDMGGTHKFDMEDQFAYIRAVQACYGADKHPDPFHSSNKQASKPEPKTAFV
eukprot:m.28873 g.28873  ORF g.28873 m.28873 type:complete len:323 (-) comp11890_c0_seq1:135-1103(-)